MVSAIDDEPNLAELLDPKGFLEVTRSFSELYGIGIKVFDFAEKKVVDVVGGEAELIGCLFRFHETQVRITQDVRELRNIQISDGSEVRSYDDFFGLRYQITGIEFGGSLMGRIIFGPYRPIDHEGLPPDVVRLANLSTENSNRIKTEELAGYLERIPRAPETTVGRILAHYRSVVDVIIHASFKAEMTNRVHIASTTESFESLKKTNRELLRANEQLRELDQLKSNFIATVSHELRTPLTSVIGYSEMLIEGMAGDLTPEQTDYVNTILEKGESLLTLIGQILDLSRIESGTMMIHQEPTDVRELAELAVSDVHPQAQKRSLKVVVDVDVEVEPIALDRDKVRRVLTNLLSNAVKFTPDGGEVVVRARLLERDHREGERLDLFETELDRYLAVEVQDSGIGIPSEKLERVFDTFYQVDNSSTRKFGGTGLGLSIARNFVVAHGGHLTVKSQIGEGSVFSFVIPYPRTVKKDMSVVMEGVRLDEEP